MPGDSAGACRGACHSGSSTAAAVCLTLPVPVDSSGQQLVPGAALGTAGQCEQRTHLFVPSSIHLVIPSSGHGLLCSGPILGTGDALPSWCLPSSQGWTDDKISMSLKEGDKCHGEEEQEGLSGAFHFGNTWFHGIAEMSSEPRPLAMLVRES